MYFTNYINHLREEVIIQKISTVIDLGFETVLAILIIF